MPHAHACSGSGSGMQPDLEAERGRGISISRQLTRDSKKRCRNPKLTPDMARTGIAAVAGAGDEAVAEAAVERGWCHVAAMLATVIENVLRLSNRKSPIHTSTHTNTHRERDRAA